MADNTLALQVQPTQFGNNFTAGYNNGIAQQAEKQKQEATALAQMAQLGLGVMDGKLDGPIDPARLEQAIGLLGNSPLAAKVKENPELLRTITKGSMDVLRYVQDAEKFELAKQQFEQELAAAQTKVNAPIEVSPGATLYDPSEGKSVFTAPVADKPQTGTDDQRELAQINEERKAAGQPALSMEEYLNSKKSQGLSVTTNPDGTVSVTQGGKLTEGQGKDVGFYTRGLQANAGLNSLEGELTNFWMANSDILPLGLGNYTRTPEFRKAKVEADNFLTAILRKDTGAAITDKEFEIYGPMFLPIPGDDASTIALKRQKRATALLAIRSGLGTAEAVAAANEGALGLDTPGAAAKGGGGDTVVDWTEMDWGE